MVQLVNQLGGRLAVFSHTYTEIHSVILGAADHLEDVSARGAIVAEMRRQNRSRSDLLMLNGKLQETLAHHGIDVRRTPPYTIPFQIDEKVFGDFLDDEIHYYNPRAPVYDINSVRSIYVLRRGTTPRTLEKARAVLVTSNVAFARAAERYGRDIEESQEVSTVITDFSLANIAWLKAPMAAPELPKKEVLAFCYAALEPSEEFLNDFLVKAEILAARDEISARDLQILRCSPHAGRAAVGLTLGERKDLSPETVTATLTRIEDEIRQEEAVKLRAEEAARIRTEGELERLATERQQARATWDRRCWRLASAAAVLVDSLIVAFLLGAATWTFMGIELKHEVLRLLPPFGVLALGGLVLGVLLPVFDLSLCRIHARVRGFVHARLLRFVLRVILLEHETAPLRPGNDSGRDHP